MFHERLGEPKTMAPKITALLALTTAFASVVFDFDETTITRTTKPAFILITPTPCEGACEALSPVLRHELVGQVRETHKVVRTIRDARRP